MNKVVKRAFIDAIGTVAYIVLVVLFFSYLQIAVPKATDTIFIPIAMLLLFVFSAGFTGILVFGKPVLMYLEGKKRKAVLLIGYTLGILFILTLIAFILLVGYYSLI